jgi:ATP-dependent Clp protease ATP-binding subunit ClpB
VDFRNTVIIMTSNVGSQYILGDTDEETLRARVMEAMRNHFRPEFLNRVDEIVIFHRLGREQLREIAEIQLDHVRGLLAKRNISLSLTEAATDLLIEEGYDPVYGARPLKRVLQRRIIDPLAIRVIQGEVREGDHVVVEVQDGDLDFRVVETGEVEEPVSA